MITKLKTTIHHALSGITVIPFTNAPARGTPQSVLVQMKPNTEIPLHTHTVDAKMYCVAGSATVLSSDSKDNGRKVQPGHLVEFNSNIAHGFLAGPQGFAFVSDNGGIVDVSGKWDMAFV